MRRFWQRFVPGQAAIPNRATMSPRLRNDVLIVAWMSRWMHEVAVSALDALTLARLQFAFTISFHIVFPAFTIGLASYLAVLEMLWIATGKAVFRTLFDYWKLPFAIAFGM